MDRLNIRAGRWLGLATLYACLATPSHAFDGTVIDGSTGKPLAGVYVIGAWIVSSGIGVVAKSGCGKLDLTRTDGRGQFNLPSWSGLVLPHLIGDETLNDYYYLPGYRWDSGHVSMIKTIVLTPDTRSPLERIGYISELTGDAECGATDERVAKALPLYKVMYEEAAALASSKSERRVLGTISFKIEVLELGYQKAIQNVINRGNQ